MLSDLQSWGRVAARLILTALLLGVVVPIMATHTVTIQLVAVSALAWCFVPIAQLLMAMLTIVPARGRTVSVARALDLWFAGHLPYTAWLLLLPVIVRVSAAAQIDLVVITFAAAIVWATSVEIAFARVVLGDPPATARRRVVLHQALMLGLVGAGVLWAAGGVAPITSFIARTVARLTA